MYYTDYRCTYDVEYRAMNYYEVRGSSMYTQLLWCRVYASVCQSMSSIICYTE